MKIVNFLLVLAITTHLTIAADTVQPTKANSGPTAPKDAKKAGKPKKASNDDPNFKPVKCNKDMIESYGLRGNNFSKNEPMDMCGPMKNGSCCYMEDQIQMFNYWNGEVGSSELKNKFKEYQSIYERHLATISKMTLTASKINSKISTLNNCKMITQTIKKFKFSKAAPKLKESAQKTFTLWEDSFKSAYCMMCSGENQKYIDLSRKTIQVSADYCWTVASSTVPFLLYFYNHLAFLTNLLTNFMTWCDVDGNFEYQQIASHLTVNVDASIREDLMACKSTLNSPDWLVNCMPVCQRVSAVNFPDYFKPHMREFQRIGHYWKLMNDKFEPPQPPKPATATAAPAAKKGKKADTGVEPNKQAPSPAQQPAVANSPAKPENPPAKPVRRLRRGRKLAERKHSSHIKVTKNSNKHGIDRFLSLNENSVAADKKMFNSANIYYEADAEPIIVGGLNRKVALETFTIIVDEEGINFQKIGQATKFTPDTLTSIKALVKLGIQSNKKASSSVVSSCVVVVLLMVIGLFN